MTGGVVGLGVGHVTGEGVADPEVGLTIDDVGGVDHTVRGVVTQGQSPERGVGDNQEACLEIGERAKVKLPTPVEMLNTGRYMKCGHYSGIHSHSIRSRDSSHDSKEEKRKKRRVHTRLSD